MSIPGIILHKYKTDTKYNAIVNQIAMFLKQDWCTDEELKLAVDLAKELNKNE